MTKRMMTVGIGTMILTGMLAMAEGPNGYIPRVYSVGPSSTMVLPPIALSTTNTWTTNRAYAANDIIVVYTNNQQWQFWSLNAGTSSNNLIAFSTTADVADNGITWRYVNPRRRAFLCIPTGTNLMSFSYVSPAVAGSGQALVGSRLGKVSSGYDGLAPWNGAVYAITENSATNTLAVHEE